MRRSREDEALEALTLRHASGADVLAGIVCCDSMCDSMYEVIASRIDRDGLPRKAPGLCGHGHCSGRVLAFAD